MNNEPTVWIDPRVWNGSQNEYFEIDVDYFRIRNDILVLKYILELLSKQTIELLDMKIVEESDIPSADFFNAIVVNIERLQKYSIVDTIEYYSMRHYVDNDQAPTYRDLNNIEGNLFKLYNANGGVINLQERVGFSVLGIDQFF